MKETDFISQMLLDTIDDSSSVLTNDFMLVDGPEDVLLVDAVRDSQRSCYIFEINGQVLEVPVNWGPFKNRLALEFTLGESEDKYKFLEIISTLCNNKVTNIKIKFTHEAGEFFNTNDQAA
jgi:hypothetical protein